MSPVGATSKAQQLVAAELRTVVTDLAVGETVRDLLPPALAGALDDYVGELAEEWLHGDFFDGGLIFVRAQKSSGLGLEVRGTGVLINDQTEIALWLDLAVHPRDDLIIEGICRLGVADEDTGKIVRALCGSGEEERQRSLVFESAEDLPWMIEININYGSVSGRSRTVRRCTECQSLYFADSSQMADLCPECAHHLYDYPRCNHDFRRERCIACFWDGSESDYTEARTRT